MPRLHQKNAPGQLRGISGAILGAMFLAGCAHTEPRIEYREVKVPVSVPCRVTLPDEPAYALDSIDLDAPLFDLVRALLVEREQRKARDVEVTAAARSCS